MDIRKQMVKDALRNWTLLNEKLPHMNIEEVKLALDTENARESPRKTFVKRIAQRYHGIRSEVLREEVKSETSSD